MLKLVFLLAFLVLAAAAAHAVPQSLTAPCCGPSPTTQPTPTPTHTTTTAPPPPPTTSAAPQPSGTPIPPPPPPPTCPVCVPPPPGIGFDQFKYGGSGCPQGSAAINLSPDKTIFTVLYDQFVSSLQPGGSITDTRKNCGLSFLIKVPPGFTCAILFADWRGFVQLDKGVTGTQRAIYYLAGSIDQRTLASDFTGPVKQDYLFRDVVPEPIFSPCGQDVLFNINSQVRLDRAPGTPSLATGLLTTDSTDGKVVQAFNVVWKKC